MEENPYAQQVPYVQQAQQQSTYAGFWIRFVAALLDIIIIGIPLLIIGMGLTFLTGSVFVSYIVNILSLIFVIYMEGKKGGTPGKLILKLRIVNAEGNYIGVPGAILRYIGKFVSALILFIGYFMIGWTAQKQGLHDKIAGTYVVRQ